MSHLAATAVHAYCLNADEDGLDAAGWSRLVSWLQPDERRRLDGFRHLESRASFLIGRGMARRLLARVTGVAPADWRFREGEYGRPEIASPETSIRFNIAHSGGMVACVLANGRDVGIDVEHVDRPRLLHNVAARSCAAAELADIEVEPEDRRQQRFLVYWTLKEAYLKARGVGVSVPLHEVSFSLEGTFPELRLLGSLAHEDPRWIFRLTQPSARHIAAIAADTRDGTVPDVSVRRFPAVEFHTA
jgi:4'-phosphopantetheinyl transferase